MRICIDSSVFVRSLVASDTFGIRVLGEIGPDLLLMIPRLVAVEVTRNLPTKVSIGKFYRLFQEYESALIIDEQIPTELAQKYTRLGLPAKADAFIGAFAEWQQVDHLLSYNRHFLRQLRNPTFEVSTPHEFVQRFLA